MTSINGYVCLLNIPQLGFESQVKVDAGNKNGLDKPDFSLLFTLRHNGKGFIGKIPWPFRGWFFSILRFLTVTLGVSIPSIGLTANNFGSFVITNIGSLGLDMGFPALFPVSNVAMVFLMGGVSKKPVVVDDQVVVRRVISLSCALDHRVVDANHGGILFKSLKQSVRNPELLEKEPV